MLVADPVFVDAHRFDAFLPALALDYLREKGIVVPLLVGGDVVAGQLFQDILPTALQEFFRLFAHDEEGAGDADVGHDFGQPAGDVVDAELGGVVDVFGIVGQYCVHGCVSSECLEVSSKGGCRAGGGSRRRW